MELLHERKEDFFDAINLASQKYNIIPAVVEKDYYVTMILKIIAVIYTGRDQTRHMSELQMDKI